MANHKAPFRACETCKTITNKIIKSKCRRCYRNADYKANPQKYRNVYKYGNLKNPKRVEHKNKRVAMKTASAIASRARCRVFGITPQQYEKMFHEQNGTCFICKKPPGTRRLQIDHDHDTGKVRRLLCFNCNVGLGYFKENKELLIKATLYIKYEAGK